MMYCIFVICIPPPNNSFPHKKLLFQHLLKDDFSWIFSYARIDAFEFSADRSVRAYFQPSTVHRRLAAAKRKELDDNRLMNVNFAQKRPRIGDKRKSDLKTYVCRRHCIYRSGDTHL